MSDAPVTPPSGGTSQSSDPTPSPPRRPNYAARRMLVTTIAITVIAAAGVTAWRIVRDDDSGAVGRADTWDRVALIDRSTGAVTTVDENGEVVDTAVGLGRVTEVVAHDDRLALIGVDRIVLTDVDDDPVVVPIERNLDVTPVVTTDGTFHLVVGEPSGGNVLLVDGVRGDVVDIGASAGQVNPLLFAETLRWSDDGSMFAVADAANFQTIIVRPGDEDAPAATFLPDQPVAVGDELIATSQVVGREADIALRDLERRSKAFVLTEIPAGGVMVDDALVMVSITGTILRIEDGAEEAEQIGTVTVPSGSSVRSVHPSLDGGRLVVGGDSFQAVVDLEGTTVFTTTFAGAVDPQAPAPDWACLPVGGDGGYHSIVSLETGEQLADLTGVTVVGTSSDGCTVLAERDDLLEVVTADGTVRLGRLRSATLGPDGRSVVITSTTGRTELVRIDDDLQLGETVDLSGVAPGNVAVAFLQG